MAEAVDDDVINIQRAYAQWRFAKDLLEHLMHRAIRNPSLDQERNFKLTSRNMFGRWLMTMQFYDWQQLDERYPLLPRQPLTDDRSKTELVRMLQESYRMDESQAMIKADELLGMIDTFLSQGDEVVADRDAPAVQFEENEEGGRIVVGEFHTPRCPRISCLVRNYGLVSTALVSMRYHVLHLYRGGESGMSVTALNALHDVGRARHEGFASPLNCRLLGRPDIKFCSLFADTDATFGSLGNFFRIRLTDHPGGWIVNPPFVEPVMEETAGRVVSLLQEVEPGSFWFFITFPHWEDNEGWRILNECEFKVARIDFEAGSFIQQDCYGEIFTLTNHRSGLNIFVLGQLPEDVDIVDLRNRMSDESLGQVKKDWLVACDCETGGD